MNEDSFLNLLENYLDMESIELKKQEDEKEIKKEKKKKQTESVFTEEDCISISRYVQEYLGIPGNCSKLYHSGLKELGCEFVMGVDNNFANKNPELVHQGYLLLVMDAKHNRGTYINPFYLKKLLHKDDVEKELKTFTKKEKLN